MRLYAQIEKTEKQNDGSLKVWGYASTDATDSDGEIITAEAMKAALPDYLRFGAVREMHQPIAAGTAIEAEVLPDGRTWFGAHVVDPVAVKKIEAGVYKGFSIGGKVTGRDSLRKHIVTGLRLLEVSLVDRPANPEAVFTMFKAIGMQDPATQGDAPAPSKGDSAAKLLCEAVKALRDCCAKLAALGFDDDPDADEDSDPAQAPSPGGGQPKPDGDYAAGKAARAAMYKRMREEAGQVAQIAKAAGLDLPPGAGADALLKAAVAELLALRKLHSNWLAQPAPAKGALNGVAIEKCADHFGQGTTKPVRNHDGVVDEVATLVKQAQSRQTQYA